MTATERSHRSAHDPTKLKKRKRVEEIPSQKKRKSPKPGGVNALPWKEVPLPDNLDDAEGFFGLEEISDVELMRDEKLGRVEYRHLKPTDTQSRNGHIPEETEWSGCDDSDPNEKAGSAPLPKPKIQASLLKSSLRKTSDKTARKSVEELAEVNGFENLTDGSDQEGDVSAWHTLGLSPQALSSIAKLHFEEPTPIQNLAIPEILRGQNVIGKASTGSGKTLAFGIPILEHYLEHCNRTNDKRRKSIEERESPPTALILSPTRELAHQLSKHLNALCSNVTSDAPQIATITGGLAPQKQQRNLANADIVVGTPGRMWEIISSTNGLMPWLRQIKFLVLDEADRLLSEGHFKELEEILDTLNKTDADDQQTPSNPFPSRQTLIFSATFSPTLNQKLSGHLKPSTTASNSLEPLLSRMNFFTAPKFIDASPKSHLPTSLNSYLLSCNALEKDLYLYALLLTHFPTARTLVFANSIHAVRRLVPFLQNLNLQVYGLHSQMPQKARMRSVERFSAEDLDNDSSKLKKAKKANILVATDVAARGLDIPSVHAVIHYHLPTAANTYVHRSGRTARQGNTGISILLCAPNEVQGTRRLVAKVYAQLDNDTVKDKGLQTLELNRHIVTRLKPRTSLAKKIADVDAKKRKDVHEENWWRNAAEELGYDSADFTTESSNMSGKKGRGKGKGKEKKNGRGNDDEQGTSTKADMAVWKSQLKGLLERRVNVGVSERYLSGGGIDVEALLEEGVGRGEFLGSVGGGLV
ncbi:MAG: hypothetical protein Q9178_003015 [Gyalolechia marmorata]